jgi:hypothetical protein
MKDGDSGGPASVVADPARFSWAIVGARVEPNGATV